MSVNYFHLTPAQYQELATSKFVVTYKGTDQQKISLDQACAGYGNINLNPLAQELIKQIPTKFDVSFESSDLWYTRSQTIRNIESETLEQMKIFEAPVRNGQMTEENYEALKTAISRACKTAVKKYKAEKREALLNLGWNESDKAVKSAIKALKKHKDTPIGLGWKKHALDKNISYAAFTNGSIEKTEKKGIEPESTALRQQLEEALKKLDTAEERNAELEAQMDNANSTMAIYQGTIGNLSLDLQNFKEQGAESANAAHIYQQTILTLTQTLGQEKAGRGKDADVLAMLQGTVVKLSQDLFREKTEGAAAYENLSARLMPQIQQLKQEKADLEEQIQADNDVNLELLDQIEELNSHIAKLEEEVRVDNEINGELAASVDSLKKANHDLDFKLVQSGIEITSLKERIVDLKDLNKTLEQEKELNDNLGEYLKSSRSLVNERQEFHDFAATTKQTLEVAAQYINLLFSEQNQRIARLENELSIAKGTSVDSLKDSNAKTVVSIEKQMQKLADLITEIGKVQESKKPIQDS